MSEFSRAMSEPDEGGAFDLPFPLYFLVSRRSIVLNAKGQLGAINEQTKYIGCEDSAGTKIMPLFSQGSRAKRWARESGHADAVVATIRDPGEFLRLLPFFPQKLTHFGFDPVYGLLSKGGLVPREELTDKLRQFVGGTPG